MTDAPYTDDEIEKLLGEPSWSCPTIELSRCITTINHLKKALDAEMKISKIRGEK